MTEQQFPTPMPLKPTQAGFSNYVVPQPETVPASPQAPYPAQAVAQVSPGQVPGQADFGQVPGQAVFGKVPGQVSPGQPPAQPSFMQLPGQAGYGQVPGQAVYGQVPEQGSPGQVPGQVSPGQQPAQPSFMQLPGQAGYGQVPAPQQFTLDLYADEVYATPVPSLEYSPYQMSPRQEYSQPSPAPTYPQQPQPQISPQLQPQVSPQFYAQQQQRQLPIYQTQQQTRLQQDSPIPVQPAYLQPASGRLPENQQGFFYPPATDLANPNSYTQQQQQWQQSGYQVPGQPLKNNFAVYLVLSILSILMGAWALPVPGIVAIVYLVSMNRAYKQGNRAEFLKSRKISRTWLIVSFAIACVGNIIYFLMFYLR